MLRLANDNSASFLLSFAASFLNLKARSPYQLLGLEVGCFFNLWLTEFGKLGFLWELLWLSYHLELRKIVLIRYTLFFSHRRRHVLSHRLHLDIVLHSKLFKHFLFLKSILLHCYFSGVVWKLNRFALFLRITGHRPHQYGLLEAFIFLFLLTCAFHEGWELLFQFRFIHLSVCFFYIIGV